jgi:hypothetical protein
VEGYVRQAKSVLTQFLGAGRSAAGSLAYRNNKDAIWRGDTPEKYSRLVELVPGERILELGAAEGVLSLMLAQSKQKVFALELRRSRHEEALRLQTSWQQRGLDVDRCEMVHGNITDHFDLLDSVDTLVAARSIYYLREDLDAVFDAVGQHVPNVVLCGNANRARQYHAAKGRTNGGGCDFNYFASVEGMIAVLEARRYTIVRVVAQGDPIVVGAKVIHPRA